ncbi:TPM domain-containing protein [Candidatus Nitrospira bockiana]
MRRQSGPAGALFSDQDLAAIKAAVEAAERRTRGEIVPMVVSASARYREAQHLGGLVLALVVLTLLLALPFLVPWAAWLERHPGGIVLGVMAAYVLGHWCGRFPIAIRLLTSEERMATKVRLRAERAFHEHGLHKTREATGVLILVSLLERRVHILPDRAIDQRVPPGTWNEIVTDMIARIRAGRPGEALCAAVTRCGDLLATHFPPRAGDNPNELPNDLIQGR